MAYDPRGVGIGYGGVPARSVFDSQVKLDVESDEEAYRQLRLAAEHFNRELQHNSDVRDHEHYVLDGKAMPVTLRGKFTWDRYARYLEAERDYWKALYVCELRKHNRP